MSRSAYNYIEVLRILLESDTKSYTLIGRIHQNGDIHNTELLITARDVTKIITELSGKHKFSTDEISKKFESPEFSLLELDFEQLPFSAKVQCVDFSPATKQIRA